MTIKERLNEKQKRNLYKILDLLPDKVVLHLQHYASLNRRLNLKKPKRFTDKIQWYKLNYRTPLMTKCADKYKVRDYLTEKGYSDFVPKLYQVVDTYDQIDFDELPNSFAVKSNNGSGTNILINNKHNINLNKIEETIKSWDKVNTLSIGREWAYKNIEPKIVIEELLKPEDEFQKKYGLSDYKIYCFNGKPEFVFTVIKRETDRRVNFYDLEWNELEVIYDAPPSEIPVPKPPKFNEMIKIAEDIANDFPFVRVDFYFVNGKVYIGELTFYPASGIGQFTPDSFDYHLGSLFDLPTPTK